MAVVVDVPHGDAVAVAPGKAGEARGRGGILEGPVPPVAEQAVPVGAGAVEVGREPPGLRQVDIEPAVSVVVEQSDAAGRGLGHVPGRGHAVIEREAQPGGLGVIQESGRPDGRGGRLGRRGPLPGHGVEVGDEVADQGGAGRRASAAFSRSTASRPARSFVSAWATSVHSPCASKFRPSSSAIRAASGMVAFVRFWSAA